jgi:hypothetical protein
MEIALRKIIKEAQAKDAHATRFANSTVPTNE